MARCMKPDPRVSKDFKICDPADGGRIPLATHEWLKAAAKGGALECDTAKRIRALTVAAALPDMPLAQSDESPAYRV